MAGLINTDVPFAPPAPPYSSADAPPPYFASAVLDIEKLEREISEHQNARRVTAYPEGSMDQSHLNKKNKAATQPLNENFKFGEESTFDTLDEPVSTTLMRDLRAVWNKLSQTLFPNDLDSNPLLRDWDLWGPLFIWVALAFLLRRHSDGGPEFTEDVFVSGFGAVMVAFNTMSLSSTLSFFQVLCVLGYCLFLPAVAAFMCQWVILGNALCMLVLRMIWVASTILWAIYAANCVLFPSITEEKRFLVAYPIAIYYAIIGWLIISQTEGITIISAITSIIKAI